MSNEVEIKFCIADVRTLTSALKRAGFRQITRSTHEMNTLYDLPGQKLRKRGELQRKISTIEPLEDLANQLSERNDRLNQLFGPPATIHQDGGIDWSWEQYSEAVAQLEAEGVIHPTDEIVD